MYVRICAYVHTHTYIYMVAVVMCVWLLFAYTYMSHTCMHTYSFIVRDCEVWDKFRLYKRQYSLSVVFSKAGFHLGSSELCILFRRLAEGSRCILFLLPIRFQCHSLKWVVSVFRYGCTRQGAGRHLFTSFPVQRRHKTQTSNPNFPPTTPCTSNPLNPEPLRCIS